MINHTSIKTYFISHTNISTDNTVKKTYILIHGS